MTSGIWPTGVAISTRSASRTAWQASAASVDNAERQRASQVRARAADAHDVPHVPRLLQRERERAADQSHADHDKLSIASSRSRDAA